MNAAGEYAPPLTVYKYARLPNICIQSAPKQWGIGKTENGWMTCESFYEYFTNVFHPFLEQSSIQLPVVVFLDGHVSHLSAQLSTFCREKQIEICCFPSHATHLLQPLDVAFFAPLKKKWKKLVRTWRLKNEGADLKKHQVPALLDELIHAEDFTEAVKNGFRTCGLHPFDSAAVNYSKCVNESAPVAFENNQEEDSSRNSVTTSAVGHRQFIESYIDANVLDQFKSARDTGIGWEEDDKYTVLYKLWEKIIENEALQRLDSVIPNHDNPPSISASRLTNLEKENDLLVFNFPEFELIDSNSRKYKKIVK